MTALSAARPRATDTRAARAQFEARVTARARSFSLKALIDLLLARGYLRERMLFQGNQEGGGVSLVHDITFLKADGVDVIITVNLGLLGDNTLLPSYFLREIERSADPDRFYDFIRFFDHRLIENYLRGLFPEDDPYVYPDYCFVQHAILKLAGVSSIASLHWLVQAIFPELRVRVRRGAFSAISQSYACRAGKSLLDGSSVIGRIYETEAQGFLVELITDEEIDDRGRSWATVLAQRVNKDLLPVLAPFRVAVALVLRVLTHESWAHLETSREKSEGYLGYDRIQAEVESGHSVVLFRGIAGATPPDEESA